MKKYSIFILALLLVFQLRPVASYATEQTATGCTSLQANQALAGNEKYTGTAQAAILYERNTQTLVYAHNPDERVNPTGLIKLLTALIVLEEGHLEDIVTVKRSTLNTVSPGAVSAGLKAGEQITVRDLLYCVMVASSNDAAAVIAEHVAGSQAAFVDKMNARAATLGCVNTHFTNVHGLQDERQYSTARDMAIIVDEAMKNEDFLYYYGVTGYTVAATNSSASRQLKTTNYMMDPDSKYYDSRVIGGKPAAATSSDRSMICAAKVGECEYLCVIISAKAKMSGGAVTRYTNFDEAKSLLDMGFGGYAVQQVLGTEQPFGLYPVSEGENHVVVGPNRQVYALLPVNFDASQLQLRDVRNQDALHAPLAEGTSVGKLQIFLGSILIGEADLIARHDVAKLGTTIMPDIADDSAENGFPGKVLIIVFVLFSGGFLLILLLRIFRNSNKERPGKKAKRSTPRERGAV